MVKPEEAHEEVMEDSPPSPPADDNVVSPPGMKMRSGRKKRRRSRETTGLTPEKISKRKADTTTPAKKKAKKTMQEGEDDYDSGDSGGSDGSEEQQTDTDDDMEEVAKESQEPDNVAPVAAPVITGAASLPVVNAPGVKVGADVGAESPAPATVAAAPPMLRLPSEQTPGKPTLRQPPTADTPYDTRYQGRVPLEAMQPVEEPPSVNRVTQQEMAVDEILIDNAQVEMPPSPVRKLFRSIQATIKEIIVPPAEGLDGDEDSLSVHSSFVHRPHFWFVTLLILQFIFFTLWLNPILGAVMGFTDQSILFYKDLLGVPPRVLDNVTRVEIPVPEPPKKITKVVKKHSTGGDEVVKHINDLAESKGALAASAAHVAQSTNRMVNQLKDVETALKEKRQSLEVWNKALTEAERELKEMLADPTDTSGPVSLDKLAGASLMDVHADVVNTANIPMWEIVSSSGCPQPPSSDDDPLVTEQDIEESVASIKHHAQETVRDITQDPEMKETIKEFVHEQLEDRGDFAIEALEEESIEVHDDGPLIGMSEEEAKKLIFESLDADVADQVGLLDVASLYNGAEIIRRGTRATTPSLKESLPLLNRLMSATKLRFYGHGPEVALSPTIPADALGQCWSFENASKSKNARWRSAYKHDHANGKYASLSVRLARPTTVKRVVIDHVFAAPGEPLTAIMDFRVVGYADANAVGEPIVLGSFRYDKNGAASQHFETAGDHLLQSVTLAVDSTHSKDYACLYRFRVLEN